MTIRSVVIAVLSDFAHIRILGPLQPITTFAYTIVLLKLSASAVRQSHALNVFYIYGCTDASSLANVSYSN